jgi:hypothetical protein
MKATAGYRQRLHASAGYFKHVDFDPIINASAGLPATAGKNTATLKNTINVAAAAAVRLNDEDNS